MVPLGSDPHSEIRTSRGQWGVSYFLVYKEGNCFFQGFASELAPFTLTQYLSLLCPLSQQMLAVSLTERDQQSGEVTGYFQFLQKYRFNLFLTDSLQPTQGFSVRTGM